MPPVYSFALKINSNDVATTYGFIVAELRGQWDGPVVAFDEVSIPGQDGTIATTLEPTLSPLDFVAAGNMSAATSSALEDAIDLLKRDVIGGLVTLIGGNRSTRQRTGVGVGFMSTIYPTAVAAKVEVKIRCRNPIAYDMTPTTVSGAVSTDIATPLGTWRSWPVVTVTTGTNPLLTYKNSSGATIATLQLTGSGTFVVDMGAKTITLGGVRHDEALTAGDFFALKPVDAPTGSPSIRSSSGSISITYPKAYA
jgi:hypothetical protein